MTNRSRITRRHFIQTTAAAAAVLSMPRIVSAANDKLNVAVIGVRGQGGANLGAVAGLGENIVALCDVDEARLNEAAAEHPDAKLFRDYRKMFDSMHAGIDAVIISTPDHLHAHATMAAMRLGKHVYCEKPLTHSVWECRQVQDFAKANVGKIATQMGTQIHATDNYRRVVEIIRSGAIGKVTRAHNWVGTSYHGGDRPKDTPPVPAGLDWDLWLGPAPERPYHPAYVPFNWRGWWDFGGGALADMACHHMDLPHWALDLRAPSAIEAEGPPVHPESPAQWMIVHYHYPAGKSPAGLDRPATQVTWYHGERRPPQFAEGKLPGDWGGGTLFEGENGKMLLADYGRYMLFPEAEFKDFKPPSPTIPASIGHHAEWVKACKEGGRALCNFDDYSGALAETVLLGNVAYKAGKKIEWDSAAFKITNAPEAEQYLRREYRKGWEL